MSINLTDEIEVKTKKGKLGAAKQIFLEGDTQTVEKEIQNINSRHNTLNTKHESLSKTVQGIAATGGASTATNVTYNNDSSRLNAENAQDAIDELQGSKVDKTSILQELGDAEDKVMSQKATTTAIAYETTRAKAAENAITFDVSVQNNGAVFESLQALLSSSNLSTLIPTSVRHGGMTIRFIQGSEQSSDNKYVQYRYMGTATTGTPNPFLDTANWQGVDYEPTPKSENLVESGGVNSRLNEVADIREKVNSIFSLLPNQLDSTFTQGEGYAYRDYTSFNPLYNSIIFNVNDFRKLNSGVEYLFFAKIKIVTEEALTFKVHVLAGSATNIVEPTKIYNTGETISVYLGKAIGNGTSSYFRAASVNTFRKINEDVSTTLQNVHAEYYGGYVVEKNQLSDIPESYYQDVAEVLDYTNTSCSIIADGKVTKLENRVNVLEENTSDISIIREDVGLLNNNSKKIDSSFDISYDAAGWMTGTVDSENHLRYIENSQTAAINIEQTFKNSLVAANKKYAIFVKILKSASNLNGNLNGSKELEHYASG